MQARTRVKFCGMTKRENIHDAVQMGVDAIGLIFFKGSQRAVDIDIARDLIDHMPAFVSVVAVFVNPQKNEVAAVIDNLNIQYLQFHGEEEPSFCEQFSIPYIKAIPATDIDSIGHSAQLYSNASALLLDTPGLQCRGGSGITFDWDRVPETRPLPLILAGGLQADNVSKAIQSCSPFAVDVCSGVESVPGIKSKQKMHEFMSAIKSGD